MNNRVVPSVPAEARELLLAVLTEPHGRHGLRLRDVVPGVVLGFVGQLGCELVQQQVQLGSEGEAAAHSVSLTRDRCC